MAARLVSKKGSEYVEASLIIPLIVGITIFFIIISIEFYSCLLAQMNLHKDILKEVGTSQATFRVVNKEENLQLSLIGKKKIAVQGYVINEALLVRLKGAKK